MGAEGGQVSITKNAMIFFNSQISIQHIKICIKSPAKAIIRGIGVIRGKANSINRKCSN